MVPESDISDESVGRNPGGGHSPSASPNALRASSGVAGRRPCLGARSAAIFTNSALLPASRSLVTRMLSSSPVRTPLPPRASTHSMTRDWFGPMPAILAISGAGLPTTSLLR